MDPFQPFELEHIMSIYEHKVAHNLTGSGAHPLKVGELINTPDLTKRLLQTELGYPECSGTRLLREEIADMYPGSTWQNVLVTVGCAEANFISLQTLVAPGEEIVVMVPNYFQVWGLAPNMGIVRKEFHLREENDWAPDLEELDEAVNSKTKLITICNPNNPTGHILRLEEMDEIIRIASRVGAWILADETYTGAERTTDTITPSFWGKYDRVLVTASLSKAFGLPGLRIGWVVAPENLVEELWMRHEYIAISATMLGNQFAEIALAPEVRPKLIDRARSIIRAGYPILEGWLEGHEELFSHVPPQASAVAFVRYHFIQNSTELVRQLIKEKSLLVVPGDVFGMDHHLRISFGMPRSVLQPALELFDEFIDQHIKG